jgi:plastocyanin
MPYGAKARAGVVAVVLLSSGFVFAAAAPANAATTHNVSLTGFSFSPKTLTIEPGDTVTWTNNGGIPHTVTADNGSFDSGSLAPGQTFTHTFAAAATVPYHCSFHGAAGGLGMAGTIVVRPAAPATTAPPVTTRATSPPSPTTPPSAPAVPAAPVPSTPTPAPAQGTAGAPAASVRPTAGATSSTSPPELAHTGSNSAVPAVFAAVLLMTGVVATISGRRRSRRDRRR